MNNNYSSSQTFWLVTLRILIGWHFLYEGLIKVFNAQWTSYGYLIDSKGWLSSFFLNMASNPQLLDFINIANKWGLVLIGLGLIAGCLTRIASVAGIVLLAFYYLSHPPFIGATYMMPSEGSYLWIDKNLIEIAALAVVLVFPTSYVFGLDKYLCKRKR